MRSCYAVALTLALICGAGTTAGLLAQDLPSKTFEVTSVKRSLPSDRPMTFSAGARQGERWRSTNATLRQLIENAYGADYPMPGQMIGRSFMDRH